MEYRSNTLPNIWIVFALGVAVKAKKLAFSGIFLASINSFSLSSISNSSSVPKLPDTAIFNEAAALPLCDE